MKKSSLIYLIFWAVFTSIGMLLVVLSFYAGKEEQLFDFVGGVLFISGGFILMTGQKLVSSGNYLTKKQIRKGSCILVDSEVEVGDTFVPNVFVIRKQIFLIQLEDYHLTLLQEEQNLEKGEKYLLNNKGEWEKVNQISVKEKIKEASEAKA